MKTIIKYFSLLVALGLIVAIVVLSALHDPVPALLTALAIGAVTGQYALLSVPGSASLLVLLVSVAGVVVLVALHIAVPGTLDGIAVAAVTGHYALSLPDPVSAPANTGASAPASSAAPATFTT